MRSAFAHLLVWMMCGACTFTTEPSFANETEGASTSDGGDTEGPPPREVGCEDTNFLATPAALDARGPWPVGNRILEIDGMVVDVWYPAVMGTEVGVEAERYDLRQHFPPADRAKIPTPQNPWQDCDCHRDLPLDVDHGPYPLIVFVHDDAGFRTQSLRLVTHWVSRGFVAVAADHRGIQLRDRLDGASGASDVPADVRTLLLAAVEATGSLSFLRERVDPSRIALVGHGAGAVALAALGSEPGVAAVITLAAGGTQSGAREFSTLIVGALDDMVTPYAEQVAGFATSPVPRRQAGILSAGHAAFTDRCRIGEERGGLLQIALDYGIAVPPALIARERDGCGESHAAPDDLHAINALITTALLEEATRCSSESQRVFDELLAVEPLVAEFREAL